MFARASTARDHGIPFQPLWPNEKARTRVRLSMRSVSDQIRSVKTPAWRLFLACCLLFICVVSSVVFAQGIEAATAERRIKAAFLYKFAGYVEWPDSAFPLPDTPVTIAIDGDDQLADEVAQVVAGRMVAGRTLVVRKLKKDASSPGAHILFTRDVHEDQAPISGTQSQPTLIVTDSQGALTRGSTINFLVVDEHVRFEVSLENAEHRGLRLSSRLLAVAENVRTGKP